VRTENIHRAAGSSVWLGKDLAGARDWIHDLSPKALKEIDDCVEKLRESPKPLAEIDGADFPFQALREEIEAFRRELATGRGFVNIRGIPAADYSDDELGMIFWGFGGHFGRRMPQSFMGDLLGTVMDVTDEEPDRRLRRGYHSGGKQDVHTDACDIVGMIGIRTAKEGGASRLASAGAVHNAMLDMCPELLKVLYQGLPCRMPDSDAEAMDVPALIPGGVPTYTRADGWLNANYVRGYVERAVNAGDCRLSPREQAAIDVFRTIGNHPDYVLEYMLEPGDIQIFNNRKIMHGRAHFDDHPEKERRRQLRRLWLSVDDWPRLPDAQRRLYGDDLKKLQASAPA
jgi:hypothetical protein